MRENVNFRDVLADIKKDYPGMLTVKQVASYMNCDARTVKRLIESRRLPAINLGTATNKLYRIPSESLARFITKE